MYIYRIQSDAPDREGATATVFFATEAGEIAWPGWTVPITTTDTLADIIARAETARNEAPQ